MAGEEDPAWIGVATTAAVRLAAEAGAEADDILEDAGGVPGGVRAGSATRLEQSADLAEVAADLAGLLWAAECEDVPPIATLLEEPAIQGALDAVAEARREAAARVTPAPPPPPPSGSAHIWFRESAGVGTREEDAAAATADVDVSPPRARSVRPLVAAAADPPPPAVSPAPPHAATMPVAPLVHLPAALPRRPAAGAVLAGAAAAAILLVGRRLRRAA